MLGALPLSWDEAYRWITFDFSHDPSRQWPSENGFESCTVVNLLIQQCIVQSQKEIREMVSGWGCVWKCDSQISCAIEWKKARNGNARLAYSLFKKLKRPSNKGSGKVDVTLSCTTSKLGEFCFPVSRVNFPKKEKYLQNFLVCCILGDVLQKG